jgi:hypothetical protein
VTIDLAAARFGEVARAAPHYESFYVKASDPGRPRGVWLRYTAFKRPGEAAVGSLWCTLWPGGGPPVARKVTLGPSELRAGDGDYIAIGASRLEPGLAAGEAGDASWELRYADAAATFPYLPRPWMYRAPVPRTKAISLHPVAAFRGSARIGNQVLELDGWPGMVGHNWGTEHAERWVWLHGAGFPAAPGTWLDLTLGRIRIGPAALPWVANGCLCLDGQRHRLGGPRRARRPDVQPETAACSFTLRGSDVTVRGSVTAPIEEFVGWRYADPTGGEHRTTNCSVARMQLEVERPGRPSLSLELPAGAAYEFGRREQPAGVTIQPFPDP